MFDTRTLPPNFIAGPGFVMDTDSGRKFAYPQQAWEFFLESVKHRPPPGFVEVPSKSRPESTVLYCRSTGVKFPNFDSAWQEYAKLISKARVWRTSLSVQISKGGALPAAKQVTSPNPRVDKFNDLHFPCCAASIGDLPLDTSKRQFVWKSAADLVHQYSPVLFDTINPCNLLQGTVGDCWLLAALSCIAEFPQQVRSVFIESQLSPSGKYTLRLFDLTQCEWNVVIVDDMVPCIMQGSIYVPVFAKPNGREIWPMILEKAFAKYLGSYSALNGGHEAYCFITITGFPLVYQFKRIESATSKPNKRATWERGWAQWNKKSPPVCGYRRCLVRKLFSGTSL